MSLHLLEAPTTTPQWASMPDPYRQDKSATQPRTMCPGLVKIPKEMLESQASPPALLPTQALPLGKGGIVLQESGIYKPAEYLPAKDCFM